MGRRATAKTVEASVGPSVESLVVAARAGDPVAFERLYARFHKVVHATVIARVSAVDADDIVQDVFGEAWAKLGSLRKPAAFPGWLRTLARNLAIDHRRKFGPVRVARDLAVDPPPRAEAVAALQALRELPATYAETLAMRLIEGLSGPEIAERTGMTPESVRVNLHRGFKLLRARLGGSR